MRFSKPWRSYQARVLEKLPVFLKDRHFHLVAAPGSGKTVIGLEIVRQLSLPTLVLAPTIAIREQWIDRLTRDYTRDETPDWVSRDLAEPRLLTISTYQSLSTEFRNGDGGAELIARLRDSGVSVLVVDEAHHLRAVWWKCLTTIKDALAKPTVISLTATPPIDVPQAEWNRYAAFCGQVDMEVGVPELVAEGNLCPHQDYVLLSIPEGEHVEELRRFRVGVSQLILDLQLDIDLAEKLGRTCPVQWIANEDSRDFVREQQAFYLALAIFLQKVGGYIPTCLRKTLHIDGEELPAQLDRDWTTALLQGLLFDFRERILLTKGVDPDLGQRLSELEKQLRHLGAIEKQRVVLSSNEENDKLLRESPAKLQSIAQIIEHEFDAQSILMRAVILTDHIRKDAFPSPSTSGPPLVKLGVVPIFELLRRIRLSAFQLGVLSGSLIVIPKTSGERFRAIADQSGIAPEKLTLKPLPHDPGYVEVVIRDADRQRAVSAATQLFQDGEIHCLVGTASLLGEGWDAPAVNTLILASVIGSFVMSNQMRGRAIRADAAVPDKTANIWHVATVPPDFGDGSFEHGRDFARLARRFEAFHGVGFHLEEEGHAVIENGWRRLGFRSSMKAGELQALNHEMFRQAEDRDNMRHIWSSAIAPARDGRFLRPVRVLNAPPRVVSNRFIARVAGKSESGLRFGLADWLERRRLQRISRAIFLALQDCGELPGRYHASQLRMISGKKRRTISAPDLEPEHQTVFITALGEFFDIFSNPRYLIEQGGRWFAVPTVLGAKREHVDHFSKRLRRGRFGTHTIHYVHGGRGEDHLLEARKQSLLRHFDFKTETKVHWEASGTKQLG
tara:strand:- start:31968 stop:34499 length:2532 start_codon:yes stop_codon:yes gene_type:complete